MFSRLLGKSSTEHKAEETSFKDETVALPDASIHDQIPSTDAAKANMSLRNTSLPSDVDYKESVDNDVTIKLPPAIEQSDSASTFSQSSKFVNEIPVVTTFKSSEQQSESDSFGNSDSRFSSSSSSSLSSTSSKSSSLSSSAKNDMPEELTYDESLPKNDQSITIPPPALASSSLLSSKSSLDSTLNSSSSSSSLSMVPASATADIQYEESLPVHDSTIKIPPAALASASISSTSTISAPALPAEVRYTETIIKMAPEVERATLTESEKADILKTDTAIPSSAHMVNVTLKNKESYFIEESNSKIQEIKQEQEQKLKQLKKQESERMQKEYERLEKVQREERERIEKVQREEAEKVAKIQREVDEKLSIVEQKQKETQRYLKEAESCKAQQMLKEQDLANLYAEEKQIKLEIESKENQLKLKEAEIARVQEDYTEIKRRAAAAQANAEKIANDATATFSDPTSSKLSFGDAIKHAFGMDESTSKETTTTETRYSSQTETKYTTTA